jgi:hypothetical protein
MFKLFEGIAVLGLSGAVLWAATFGLQVGGRDYEVICVESQCGLHERQPPASRAETRRRFTGERSRDCLRLPLSARWSTCEHGVETGTAVAFSR